MSDLGLAEATTCQAGQDWLHLFGRPGCGCVQRAKQDLGSHPGFKFYDCGADGHDPLCTAVKNQVFGEAATGHGPKVLRCQDGNLMANWGWQGLQVTGPALGL